MRYLIFTILILFSNQLLSQKSCTFSYLINTKKQNSLATGQYLLPNGNFLLTNSDFNGKVDFIEMNDNGSIIAQFSHSFYPGTNSGEFEQMKNLIFDVNGNIYGCGNEISGFIKKGFVFKMDKSYQVLAIQYFEDICILDMEWNANNNLKLFCLSSSVNRNESFIMNLSQQDLSLISNNQIVTYNNLYDHHEFSLKTTNGYLTSGGYDYSYYGGKQDGIITLIDENDAIVWSVSPFSHLNQFSNKYTHKIVETNNDFIISGIGTTVSDTTERLLIASIDKNGQKTNWIKSIIINGAKSPNLNSFLAHDGGFLLAGTSDNQSDINIFAIALDNLGNLKWSKSYGKSNSKEIISNSNIISKNNYLYFYLNTNGFSITNKLLWFATNQNGVFNFNASCFDVNDLSVELQNLTPSITTLSYNKKDINPLQKQNNSVIELIQNNIDTLCPCFTCSLSSAKLPDTIKYEYGDTILIQSNIKGENGFATINWSYGSGDTICLSQNCFQLNFIPKCSTPCICSDSKLSYIVRDSLGCELKDSTYVKNKMELSDIIKIPNAFTPNSDKTNDFFTAVPMDQGCFKRIKLIRIFNRWGKVVYQDVDLNTGDFITGWDGKSDLNGEDLNSDIFTYQIEVELSDQSTKVFKGEVLLIR